MKLSNILGATLLIASGFGTAQAQGTAVAGSIPTAPPPVATAQPLMPNDTAVGGSFHHSRDKNGHRGHDRHFRGFWPIAGVGYWGHGGGYVYTEPSRDMFGFFGTDGDVRLVDGEAVYDYDRSYPYDWFDDTESMAGVRSVQSKSTAYVCETNWVSAASGGGEVAVRVCRR